MQYFSEIVTFTLLGAVVYVLILGMHGYPYPDSDLFAGIVGFSIREIAQSLNNYYNRKNEPGGE